MQSKRHFERSRGAVSWLCRTKWLEPVERCDRTRKGDAPRLLDQDPTVEKERRDRWSKSSHERRPPDGDPTVEMPRALKRADPAAGGGWVQPERGFGLESDSNPNRTLT